MGGESSRIDGFGMGDFNVRMSKGGDGKEDLLKNKLMGVDGIGLGGD